MTTRHGFKFVAPDLTTRDHTFSYLEALRTGEPLTAPDITIHNDPCPDHEGDGLCVALTVGAACSGGQSASTAVGLLVEFPSSSVFAEHLGKVRVAELRVTGVFDPMHLIRLGLCADLQYADLQGANLRGANLQYADLQYANLQYADLQYANLQYADLQGADLQGANLQGANLRGANLQYADLRVADLRVADLRCANLRCANLQGANLRGVRQ